MDPPALPVSFVSGSDEEDSTGDVSGGTAPAAYATAVTAPTHAGTTAAPTTAVPAPATRAGEAPGLPGHDEWAGTPAESTRPRHHPTARHRERGEEEMKGEEEDGDEEGGEEWGGGGRKKGVTVEQAIPEDMDQVIG